MEIPIPAIDMVVIDGQVFISGDSVIKLLEVAEAPEWALEELQEKVYEYQNSKEHYPPFSLIGGSTLIRTLVAHGKTFFHSDGIIKLAETIEVADWLTDELREAINDCSLNDQGLGDLTLVEIDTNTRESDPKE